MKYRKLIFLFIILFFIHLDVFACDANRLSELRAIAEKVDFTYEYQKINNDVKFTITAFNLNKEIKPLIIKDYYLDDYQEFKYNTNKQSSLSGFEPGTRVKVTFNAYTTDSCGGSTVYTKTISLPYYNQFYNSSECQQYPNFKYCQSELLTSSISSSQFASELKQFLKQEEDKPITDNNSANEKNNNLLDEYKGLILIIFIAIILIILIIMKIKQVKKSNRL